MPFKSFKELKTETQIVVAIVTMIVMIVLINVTGSYYELKGKLEHNLSECVYVEPDGTTFTLWSKDCKNIGPILQVKGEKHEQVQYR